jgi:hypothetical protein
MVLLVAPVFVIASLWSVLRRPFSQDLWHKWLQINTETLAPSSMQLH